MMSACSFNRVKFAYLQGRQSSLFKSIRRALSNKENSGRIDLPIVEVKKAKLRLFREGNSIVFDGAVQNTKGSPKQGDLVNVTDSEGRSIAKGLYNPNSSYAVRIIAKATDSCFNGSLSEILRHRLEKALALRRTTNESIANGVDTTVYRLVNGEGDALSGLIIDVLGGSIVIQSGAAWVEVHKDLILNVLKSFFKDRNKDSHLPSSQTDYSFIWRTASSRLALDGYKSANGSAVSESSIEDGGGGPRPQHEDELESNREEIVKENGILYVTNPGSGQKTGFYSDQRDNRLLIRELSFNKSVLDLFCYSGGFSLNALKGGATSVLGVDSSGDAVAIANKNLRLNSQLFETNEDNSNKNSAMARFIQEDAMELMKKAIKMNQKFDIVICDPPKLAPKQKDLERARTKYVALNALALQLVRPGGLLFSFSCSSAVTQRGLLEEYIDEAAASLHRLRSRPLSLTILARRGPALADHPVSSAFKESDYLSAILVRVDE